MSRTTSRNHCPYRIDVQTVSQLLKANSLSLTCLSKTPKKCFRNRSKHQSLEIKGESRMPLICVKVKIEFICRHVIQAIDMIGSNFLQLLPLRLGKLRRKLKWLLATAKYITKLSIMTDHSNRYLMSQQRLR